MSLPVNTTSKIISNIYIRQSVYKNIDDENEGWISSFDRMLLLTSGSLKILSNNETVENNYEAPVVIKLDKSVSYRIISKKANTTTYHIHAIRNGETLQDIVDPDLPTEQLTQLAIDWPITNRPTPNTSPILTEPETN